MKRTAHALPPPPVKGWGDAYCFRTKRARLSYTLVYLAYAGRYGSLFMGNGQGAVCSMLPPQHPCGSPAASCSCSCCESILFRESALHRRHVSGSSYIPMHNSANCNREGPGGWLPEVLAAAAVSLAELYDEPGLASVASVHSARNAFTALGPGGTTGMPRHACVEEAGPP